MTGDEIKGILTYTFTIYNMDVPRFAVKVAGKGVNIIGKGNTDVPYDIFESGADLLDEFVAYSIKEAIKNDRYLSGKIDHPDAAIEAAVFLHNLYADITRKIASKLRLDEGCFRILSCRCSRDTVQIRKIKAKRALIWCSSCGWNERCRIKLNHQNVVAAISQRLCSQFWAKHGIQERVDSLLSKAGSYLIPFEKSVIIERLRCLKNPRTNGFGTITGTGGIPVDHDAIFAFLKKAESEIDSSTPKSSVSAILKEVFDSHRPIYQQAVSLCQGLPYAPIDYRHLQEYASALDRGLLGSDRRGYVVGGQHFDRLSADLLSSRFIDIANRCIAIAEVLSRQNDWWIAEGKPVYDTLKEKLDTNPLYKSSPGIKTKLGILDDFKKMVLSAPMQGDIAGIFNRLIDDVYAEIERVGTLKTIELEILRLLMMKPSALGKFGVSTAAAILCGSKNKKILENQYDRLPYYGKIDDATQSGTADTIKAMIDKGYIRVLHVGRHDLPVIDIPSNVQDYIASADIQKEDPVETIQSLVKRKRWEELSGLADKDMAAAAAVKVAAALWGHAGLKTLNRSREHC